MRYSRSAESATSLVLRRRRRVIEVDFATRQPGQFKTLFWHRGPTALLFLAACPPDVRELSIDIGDGIEPTTNTFGFSFNAPDIVLLPDPYFVNSLGLAELHATAAGAGSWRDRQDRLRWRGTDTGAGIIRCTPDAAWDDDVKARIRLCLIAASIPGTDCRLYNSETPSAIAGYEAAGIFGDPIPQPDSIHDRYALDIDGHSNSWSNLLARMALGCCVFRVESHFGYRQWYHDRVISWVHYVPVQADMRDLAERLDWARTHPDKAEEIARAGQALAREMTMKRELDFAVRAIREMS